MQPTVKEVIAQFKAELAEIYSIHEAFQFVWLLFEHLHGWSKTDLMLHDHTKLTVSDHLFVQKALERLKNHEPIQYIIGKTEFYGLPFNVNSSVLVPRPETEELVEWILHSIDPNKPLKILDIGTGSGCIAISLAKNLPQAKVTAWDISEEALQTAARNAGHNQVELNFEQKNILTTNPSENNRFDIIVSNPPYVMNSEKEQMHNNVLDYEPHLALFVEDDDALLFYRKITEFAAESLSSGGMLFFEINRAFGEATKKLVESYGFRNTELRKDLSGNHRMIKAYKR
ncbi:peptide chain release factor N(5)-glutamine methyltransferase [Marinilabilia rubra]|uniref:Release factor glutamine methyltransferase n=1 Tax=Marinilabilia rubra TaxID=2162893 RepID=A0A2U2B8D6_9BACT|nr:peptide chain release factor N(5)-glutamine methyltransferase [Marinilabilia rubra]PWD99328.1 peptide chain release factor N(5)-glutamine methyltransferase [Marinilabilia rubra]